MPPGCESDARHHRSSVVAMEASPVGTGDGGSKAALLAGSGDGPSRAVTADYRYPGGKGLAGVCQWILAHFPTHAYYAEPFCGKGAIFRRKPPALRSYLIDENPAVIDWWRRRGDPGAIVQIGDGIRWLELAAEWADEDLLVYVDPPYVLETRTKKRLYRRELNGLQHRRLLEAILRCRARIAISGYASRMYDEALAGWQRCTCPAITRGGVMRTEVLWMNYDPAAAPTDLAVEYSALGHDFRERERVARKIKRWVTRIRELGRREREALLRALLDAERSPSGIHPRAPTAGDDDEDLIASRGGTGSQKDAAASCSGSNTSEHSDAVPDTDLAGGLIADAELKQVIKLDETVKESRRLIEQADKQQNQMLKGMIVARATQKVRDLITPAMMKDVMRLMGSPLGFLTDRDRDQQKYKPEEVKDALIIALVRGFQPVNNEFNLISGGFYAAKNGLERIVREWPGLTDLVLKPGVPVLSGDGRGALVPYRATWKIEDRAMQLECVKFDDSDSS